MTLPNCRLFLVAPGDGDVGLLADCLSAALESGDVASLLVTNAPDAEQTQITAGRLLPIAQSGEVAGLVERQFDLAKQLNADGIEVATDVRDYKSCRAELGPDMMIGANCGGNRHMAMEMAEAGADYVRIDPSAAGPGEDSIISWWAQLFEVPCVAAGPLEPETMAQVAGQGADFIQPGNDMWTSPKMASQVIAESMAAIRAAQR